MNKFIEKINSIKAKEDFYESMFLNQDNRIKKILELDSFPLSDRDIDIIKCNWLLTDLNTEHFKIHMKDSYRGHKNIFMVELVMSSFKKKTCLFKLDDLLKIGEFESIKLYDLNLDKDFVVLNEIGLDLLEKELKEKI